MIDLDKSANDQSFAIVHEDIPQTSLQPYLSHTIEECVVLKKSIIADVEPDLNEQRVSGMDVEQNDVSEFDEKSDIPQMNTVIVDVQSDFKLTDAQKEVVAELKACIERCQLLGFLQGFPGAGKTTTCKKMEDFTRLKALYCGSTGTASAQFKSKTINSLLSLGLSVDRIDLTTEMTSAQMISKIVQIVQKFYLILLDEASMITPVTLARIDLRLRQCFDPELPFGGKHFLLVGDMWQFPPVSTLSKPALYQSAVVVATNKRVPSEAYRAGANLFTQFKLLVLNEQQRCDKDYADFLAPLRDTNVQYPITREWLSKLKVLRNEDVKEQDSPWHFAPVAVTGNVERLTISKFKAEIFGQRRYEPIVTWLCQVRSGVCGRRTRYAPLDINDSMLDDKYSVLQKFFVRGAPCVLSENLSSVKDLAKGRKGTLESLVWDNSDFVGPVPDLKTLPRGEISQVPQPRFVLIRVDGELIPLEYANTKLENISHRKSTVNYRDHRFELLFSVTYHKLQGLTLDALVLSINKHPNPKLRLTLPSLYVGASRLHNIDELRVLPFKKDDADYLITLCL